MFLALSLFVAAASGYKTWCLEINCDGTTWGTQSDVKVFDQTVLRNKDKRAHSILCKGCPVEFKATLQPGGSFIFNSSLPGTFKFIEEGTTIGGTIEISTLVPVGVKVIKVSTLGFVPPVLDIAPGDTVNVVLGETSTGQLHGIRSEATATVAEGFLIDRLLGGISFGTTDVLEGSKVLGAVRYFDPKYPQNKGVINIIVPPDNRPAEPDNVGCTSAPLCAAAGGTPAPAVPGVVTGADGSVILNNPPTATVDCTRGCSNAVLGTSRGEKPADRPIIPLTISPVAAMQQCMSGCATPTPVAGPFDCDGMKCFVRCSADHECSECRPFVTAKCAIAINPQVCDVDCNVAPPPLTLPAALAAVAALAALLFAD
jgi:hypothetical protein